MWTVLGNQAKEAVRLQADVETLAIDLRQCQSRPGGSYRNEMLFSMAGKEADLLAAHAAMQVGKMLTPEQRQKPHHTLDMMGRGGV